MYDTCIVQKRLKNPVFASYIYHPYMTAIIAVVHAAPPRMCIIQHHTYDTLSYAVMHWLPSCMIVYNTCRIVIIYTTAAMIPA